MRFVYAYLDPRKPGNYTYGQFTFDYEPFYIGMGVRSRDTSHLREARHKAGHEHPKIAKIQAIWKDGTDPIIRRLREKLTNAEAAELEQQLIRLIGRQDLNQGPLTNLSDGGEASNLGYISNKRGTSVPTETRQKISETLKNRYVNDPSLRQKATRGLRDYYATPQGMADREKRAKQQRGSRQSEETVAKRSKAVKQAWESGKFSKREVKHTEESKALIGAASKARMKDVQMPVGKKALHWKGYLYSVEHNKYWETAKEAAKEIGVSPGAIVQRKKSHPELWYYVKELPA